MTDIASEINVRLDQVRHRWRRLEIIKAVSVGVVEALGLLMVFMLVDYLYAFSPAARMILLLGWVVAVLVVVARYVARPLRRKINDAELALFIEERNPGLQGALLAATEFGHDRGTPLHNYIVDVLVREAGRRIQFVDIRRTLDFTRLRKYGFACLVVIAGFVLTGALFPQYFWRHTHRMLAPWAVEPEGAGGPWSRGLLDPDNLKAPIRFRITPRDIEVVEGGSVQVIAELSRDPLGQEVTLLIKGERTDWEKIPMPAVERIYTHAATIEDVSTPLEYYVGVGPDASEHYKISVRKRLRVVGLEMTTEYPAYLRRSPVTLQAYSGDIATVKGSRVTVAVKTNQPIVEGKFVMGDGSEVSLVVDSSGGQAALAVEKDDTYRYVVRNRLGEEVGADRLFFIQALPDRPPTLEVLEPNNDLTVHPLSEITCSLKVTEDWALDTVRMNMELIRQGPDGVPQRQPLNRDFLPAAWTAGVTEGVAATTLALDELESPLKSGDSIFYHFDVTDRKGQKAVSDLFFVSVCDPEVFIFYGDLDWHAPDERIPISPLMQFIAAAWNLEQQRDTLGADEFLEKSKAIARKMLDPVSGNLIDFIHLGVNGDNKGPILADSDPRKKVAADHTRAGYELLDQGEPGKAVFDLKIVWAILKQFMGDKSILLVSPNLDNPNVVMLERSQDFAQVISDLSRMEPRNLPEMGRELRKMADQQVEWRRKLGRKEMEKVADARKDIDRLKRDVERIAEEAQEQRESSENRPETQQARRPGEDQGKPVTPKGRPRQTGTGGEQGGQEDEQRPEGETGAETGTEQPRDQTGTPAEGKGSLAERTRQSARRAEDLAKELQDTVGDRDDQDIRNGLNNLRGAADELKRAARDFAGEDLDLGATRARTAHRFLDRADKDLASLKSGRLGEMVAEALSSAHRLAGRQKQVGKATEDLAGKADEIKEAEKKGDRRVGAEKQLLDERTTGLARAQTALSEQAEAFRDFVGEIQQAAEESKEPRVAGLVEDGVKTMKRRELPQRMVDAAVEIAQRNFGDARRSQENASETLQGVLDSLYRASDALSGTRQAALEQAARRARDIKTKTLDLAGLKEKDVPGAGGKPDAEAKEGEGKAKGGERPGDEKQKGAEGTDVARTDAEGKGKEGPGDEKQKGAEGTDVARTDTEGKGKEGQPTEPTAEKGKGGQETQVAERGDEGAEGEGKERGGTDELSRSRRQREASRLWSEVQTLAGDLQAMEYVPKGAKQRLGAVSEGDFQGMFDELDDRQVKNFIALIAGVSKLLDEKLLEAQTAKKLESGLREECPPGYRRLVGRYYSVLSAGD